MLDITLENKKCPSACVKCSKPVASTCGKTIPQALQAFFESTDFESAIRLAVGLGGDTDTLGAIVGGPAGAYYGVPSDVAQKVETFLTEDLREAMAAFEVRFHV